MPHCIVEYASELKNDVSPARMMEIVFTACVDSQLFQRQDIKVRAISFDDYLVGNGDRRFLHVCLKILDGRSPQQKQNLSQSVLQELVALGLSNTEITVDVCDTVGQSYSKHRE